MNKYIAILLTIVSLISCDSKKEKPTPFLDHDQMVDIMTDLSLAEGTRIYARTKESGPAEGEFTIEDYYAMVFEKYNITQAQLDSINAWYINYPDENQAIFKEVLDRLNKLQANQKALVKEQEKLKLSAIKAKKSKAKSSKKDEKHDDKLSLKKAD